MPVINADTTAIQNLFMLIVRDIKEQGETIAAASNAVTAQVLQRLREDLSKGQDSLDLRKITAEDLTGAALIENVLPSIRITAVNIQKRYPGLLLETDDLVQEALIGVLRAIKTYDQETENLFLTYSRTTAENAMLDYVRKCASVIPASGSILSLDAPPPGFDSEANITYADILPDDYNKNPEHSLSEKRRSQRSEMPLEKSPIVNEPIFITASVFSIMCFMIKVKPPHIFISA